MITRTLLINHLTGCKVTEWENEPDDITRLDEDPNGFWLIRVPDEEQYFMINPGDTIIFIELGLRRDGYIQYGSYSSSSTSNSRREPVEAERGLYAHQYYSHCASVTFKDYCDKENRLIKVKSYFCA